MSVGAVEKKRHERLADGPILCMTWTGSNTIATLSESTNACRCQQADEKGPEHFWNVPSRFLAGKNVAVCIYGFSRHNEPYHQPEIRQLIFSTVRSKYRSHILST
jgi:hypothetical protein